MSAVKVCLGRTIMIILKDICMKYIVLLGDGMSDEPIAELNGKTPLQAAVTKAFDKLAPLSMVGLVKTIPDGMPPGSDTANLSVLGYDPQKYYSGRSPLEAVSMGINMACTDVAYRCNLVTLDASRTAVTTMPSY